MTDIPDFLEKTGYIGQSDNRKLINFYVNNHKKTRYFPHTIIESSYGLGKTELARAIGKNLLDSDGNPKLYLEINGSSLKTVRSFFEDVYVPFVSSGQELTITLDEIQKTSIPVQNWLLSVLNPNEERKTTVQFDGQSLDFDFSKVSFIAATTNPDQLLKPLLSRLNRISLQRYTNFEIEQILKKHSKNVTYKNDIEKEIVSHLRGNPRQAMKMAQDNIVLFCSQNKNFKFGPAEWEKLKAIVNIKPLGLSNLELDLLSYLKSGPKTLTNLAAYLNLDVSTVRKDTESFLLAERLITIDGKRFLTKRGLDILNQSEKQNS